MCNGTTAELWCKCEKKGSQCDVLMCLMTIHMVKNKKERKIHVVKGLTREKHCVTQTGKGGLYGHSSSSVTSGKKLRPDNWIQPTTGIH